MIEVVIRHRESGAELGRIEIENVTIGKPNAKYQDYSVRIGVDRINSVGIYQRGLVSFFKQRYNVLALLKMALETLEPEDLELDGPYEDRHYYGGNLLDGRRR